MANLLTLPGSHGQLQVRTCQGPAMTTAAVQELFESRLTEGLWNGAPSGGHLRQLY